MLCVVDVIILPGSSQQVHSCLEADQQGGNESASSSLLNYENTTNNEKGTMKNRAEMKATAVLMMGVLLVSGCSSDAAAEPTPTAPPATAAPEPTAPSVEREPAPTGTYQAPVTSVETWQTVITDNQTATFQAPEEWKVDVLNEEVVGHDGETWYQNYSEIETGKPWTVHYYDGPFNDVNPCLPADSWESVSAHTIDSILGEQSGGTSEEENWLTQHQVIRWVEQTGDTWSARIALTTAPEIGCQPVAGGSDGVRNVQFEMTRTLNGVSANANPYLEFPTREEAVQFLSSDDAEVVVAAISSVRFSGAPADSAP